jgi:hypothetical protein
LVALAACWRELSTKEPRIHVKESELVPWVKSEAAWKDKRKKE